MSHLSQSFQGLWHLMTFPESVALLGPGAAALGEMAKKPGDLGAAVILGANTFTALLAAGEISAEDKALIPGIFQPTLEHLKTLAAELSVIVNGTPGTPDEPVNPEKGIYIAIPGAPAVPGDDSKAPDLAAATKAYAMASAAVQSAIAAAS